jgi:hypothetical protein
MVRTNLKNKTPHSEPQMFPLMGLCEESSHITDNITVINIVYQLL